MRHLFRNFYVLDTRMTWKILLLLFPSACAMLYYTWAKWKDQKERMEFFERHFVCNMKNIEEGRPYTVLTSAFGASGNFSAHTVSEICSLLLFGGFFIRNIGFLRTAAFFYGAHTFSTIVSLLFNHVPMRKIEAYREWLPKGEEAQFSPYKIRFEKKKLAFAVEDELAAKGVTDYFEIERRQREILGMEDEQFLTYAYNYYLNRVAYTSGAGLATTFLVSMLYPKGLIPFPMIGIPLFIFAPFQLYLSIQNHYQYTNLELVAQTSSIILFPALMAITFIKRQHFVRDLPSNMMDQLNMAKWLPRRDIKIKKSVEKEKIREIPGMEKKTVLSKEEIEMMRKRNEKIQNRMKNKGM